MKNNHESKTKLLGLIEKNLVKSETSATKALIEELSFVRKKGYLTKSQLIKICYWKSPRAIHLIRSNSSYEIKKLTTMAFKTEDEKEKILGLSKLSGVSYSMASAILTLTDPNNYGVLDFHTWQILFFSGIVTTNQKGISFKVDEWIEFLTIIRQFAEHFKTSSRLIEITLFNLHKTIKNSIRTYISP